MSTSVPGKRAFIYCRVSSEMQRKNGSLDEQEKGCRAYCERLGYPVVTVVHEVFDGPHLDRPELQKVLLAARQGKFDVLVADLMDRFSRADEAATYALMYQLQQYGVATELSEVDVNSIEGQIMRAVLMVLAKVEHKKLVSRTQSGRRRRAEAGRLFFARYSLFGYKRVEAANGKYEEYVIDEYSASIVRRIVAAVRCGIPLRKIFRELDRDGVLTPAMYALQNRGQKAPRLQPGDEWAISPGMHRTPVLHYVQARRPNSLGRRAPRTNHSTVARCNWPLWSQQWCHRSALRRSSAGGWAA
jgi:DNA invertase Pin-like site-specific DNA recombinase